MPKVTVNFRKESTAREFADNFSILDVDAKVTAKGSTATVVTSDPRVVGMVKAMMADLSDDSRVSDAVDSVLTVLRSAVVREGRVFLEMADGSRQIVMPSHARALARAHDMFAEENQRVFLLLVAENKEAYARAVDFAQNHEDSK